MEETCCVVKERSVADKEQQILSELREIKSRLIKMQYQIIGGDGNTPAENDKSPCCLSENVDMNMRLISDISVLVSCINEAIF